MANPIPQLNLRRWREALRGERDHMEVLVETFGDKHTAFVVMSLVAAASDETRAAIKANRWAGFVLGVLTVLVIGAIVRLWS